MHHENKVASHHGRMLRFGMPQTMHGSASLADTLKSIVTGKIGVEGMR
jgi:hypothetical protein